MGDKSRIEWTDASWNPVTGCTKVSQGCKNCYALRDWPRLAAPRTPPNIYTSRDFTDVQCHPERIDQPLRWRTPRRVFVNSMSDLFHEYVSFDFIDCVCEVMNEASHHVFQVLTKRPARMRDYMASRVWPRAVTMNKLPPPNIWLGVSIEDQVTADERIPLLLQTPAAVRWISAEPLLGPIDLRHRLGDCVFTGADPWATGGGLDWVVVGGESGPKARPFDIAWARDIVTQCKAARVPVFVKQIGSQPRGWCAWNTPECIGKANADEMRADGIDVECADYQAGEIAASCGSYGKRCLAIKDAKGADPSEWPEDLRVREYPL